MSGCEGKPKRKLDLDKAAIKLARLNVRAQRSVHREKELALLERYVVAVERLVTLFEAHWGEE